MERFSIGRLALIVSLRCNLKCKLCAAYSPYYGSPQAFSLEVLKRTIDKSFEVIDFVEKYIISGGEPLIYDEIDRVLEHLLTYSERIGKIEILTNGSVALKADMIKQLEKTNQVVFFIDNYGEEKSKKVNELEYQLKNTNTWYTVRNYTDKDPYCNGWVDFGDHSNRGYSKTERENLFKKCAYPSKLGFCHGIIDGKVYLCAKSRRLEELGIQIRREEEFLDFFDESISVEEKRKRIRGFEKLTYLEACAYCNGLCEDSERFIPAEQMEKGKVYEPR